MASNFSQDANTQTGAKIVDIYGNEISYGANRMHFGMLNRYEGEGERILLGRKPEDDKYANLTHAERDAIYRANRNGISLIGSTIYATWSPCKPCAEVIIKNGIKRVVTHQACTDWNNQSKQANGRQNWNQSLDNAIDLLKRNNVKYECLSDKIGGVQFLFDDKIRRP